MVVPQSSPPFRRLPASFCVGAVLVGNLVAQAPVRLAQETPFLREPGGLRLVTLAAGTRVVPGRASGEFVEVRLSGWIFTKSTRPDKRDGFDLSVNEAGGENVRDAPDGNVLARAVEGALFSRVTSRGGWTQIRRAGWVARSAVQAPARAAAAPAVKTPVPAAVKAQVPAAEQRPPRDSAVPAVRPATEPPAARRGTLTKGTALSTGPEGATLATLSAPAQVTITGSDREWVRVAVEGWVRASDVSDATSVKPAITAAMLRDNPERYVGQSVEWRVQFLAHQHADELRPEMPLGHPYLLARGPLPESGFVYVMISKEQADRLQGLKPLDEIAITATVRAARTRYLATPVVELVRLGGEK